ncbi:14693_t:CDS:2, partial [Entrophospora sp. SA101]
NIEEVKDDKNWKNKLERLERKISKLKKTIINLEKEKTDKE